MTTLPREAKAQDASVSASDLISGKPQQLPREGMVTMVDIGAHSCIPCKMMTPIIEALSKEYEGRAVIAFIDVWEHREEGAKYGIRAIPTQIFYDAHGKEQYRHVGFLDKERIVAKLTELGVK
ncbi:thioredoxin family protein [Desulfovibrio inopinatus]|uniref:thioredoxin family protein n=1 Tax=Desulfovibrio inopinatus TaxID=102109 RepID=UPI000A063C1B|nr:thioredoxin family protein [Desulfovibrio inopinatus]